MKRAIILHGTNGTSTDNWFPWLKKELENKGFSVWTPDLPHANYPNTKIYNEFLLKNAPPVTKDTILIGHSSGTLATLGFLQALPANTKVKAVFLVAAFKDNLGWIDNKGKHILGGLFEQDYDWKALQKKAGKYVLIHAENDPYCPMSHASYLSIKLNGELVINPHQKHFSIETMGESYKQLPFL